MFCNTILDQNKALMRRKEIPSNDPNLKQKEKMFYEIIKGEMCIFTAALEMNLMDAK